ncbi:MAG: putative bifunctional diguanylate cyclase/phosphodiesterase, partial [Methylomonas sp.]
ITTGSIGITLYPNDAKTSDELIKNADQAMYVSKSNGRNCFSYFTRSMQDNAQARLKLTSDLRTAVAQKQFELFYQPIVDLSTGKIHKAEALIRWNHPARGIVSPADFIPIAEENGLIIEMGDWIFKEAANFAKHISKATNQAFQISVNKSPIQFNERLKGEDWLAYLNDIGLQPKQIVVEITEGLLLNLDATVRSRLLEFRDAGIEVAIDDFGTGYSSLSYLHKFDIDYLKIDQSFTKNIQSGSSEMAICEAIILMAHKLGLKVIAEGVETEDQRNLLAAAGCDLAQGYLYSKPLPAKDFECLLGIS